MMGRIILSSFGATSRRAAAAGHGILSSASIAMLLSSVLVLATSSCSGAGSSIVGSTTQDVQSFQATAGNDQVGTAGSDLPTPITVRALAKGGQGVSGISVQWTFSGGGGSLTPGGTVSQSLTTVTDKQGNSSVYWQLDTIAGDQTATATLSGASSNSTTSVKFHSHGKAGGPATLVVSPKGDTLAVGDSAQFTATVLDRWKNVISGATVTWSSSNDSVLTVSSTGMARALRSGSATVIATTSASSTSAAGSSSISGGASVSVESSTASTAQTGTVTVTPASLSFASIGATAQLSAVAKDSAGNTVTNPGFTWKSLATSIATVSAAGLVTANAVGATSIVVTAACCGSAATAVTVAQPTPTVTVTPATLSLTSIGATAQLTAVARDSAGNTVTNPAFTWKTVAASVATVSSSGLVSAKAVGATAIIVTAACCGSDTTAVTVDTPGTPLFADGFESYAVGSTITNHGYNGWVWGSAPSGAGGPNSVTVSTDIAHSGTKSLKFHYNGGSNDEQRFSHPKVTHYWVEFYVYYPNGKEGFSTAFTEPTSSPSNEKFWTVWPENYNEGQPGGKPSVMFQTWASKTGGGNAMINAARTWPTSSHMLYGPPALKMDPFLQVSDGADLGRWIQIRIEIKVADVGVDNGIVRLWKDGQLAFETTTDPLYDPYGVTNYLRQGYLMGWTNALYAPNTNIYVDDFKFYTANPGW